ncbi:MAG: phosphoadenylyl-sulfate reductase [Chloroflexota bacterium]
MVNATPLFNQQSHFDALNLQLKALSLDDLLRWSLWTFGGKIAQVTSFGPSGIIILDRLAKLSPGIRVITVDTSFLFPETYTLWQDLQDTYEFQLDIRRSDITPLQQFQRYGNRLWESEPDQCCQIRKVVPLAQSLDGLDAWITGIRRDQSSSRARTQIIEWDVKHQMVKVNPLAYWDQVRIWQVIRRENLPYNSLHLEGYTSIGCAQCTKPAEPCGDERSGRWQGIAKTECGIHTQVESGSIGKSHVLPGRTH